MKFKSRDSEELTIDLTSMIDVVFLLLIFFMVSSSFIKVDDKLDLRLPKSIATVKSKKEKQNIEITYSSNNKHKVYYNGNFVTFNELRDRLRSLSATPDGGSLIIKADTRIDHGFIIKVMGICKAENIFNIGFSAVQDAGAVF